jgi:uncharacterized membrane protein YccF (DUF307 family)
VRLILSIVWLVFSGLWLAILFAIAGVIACVLIVTIPLGLGNFKLISVSLTPLGREFVASRT